METTGVSVDLLSRLQPIGALGRESLGDLAAWCHADQFPRNCDPFATHAWNGRVIYLVKGQLRLDGHGGEREVLVGGSGKALLPIAKGNRPPKSAKAITDVDLLSIDEDPLDIVITWDQLAAGGASDASAGEHATDWRMMSGMFTVDNLTQGAFASMPTANIGTLLGRFERLPVKRGEVVIRQGDPGDYYYLIERGRCSVTRSVAGAPVQLAELRDGDVFGEEALVADTNRNATVTMKTDGVILRLSKKDFVELLREPLMQRIRPEQARQRFTDGTQWIDVRFPAEFQQDGLAGAINVPLNDIRQASQLLDRDRQYIVYCQTGRRSAAAAFLLSQRGIRVELLEGGLTALVQTKENAA